MKKLITLGSAIAIAALAGCATSPQTSGNSAAYTPPPTFNYNSHAAPGMTTSNPGSMFNGTNTSENNDL